MNPLGGVPQVPTGTGRFVRFAALTAIGGYALMNCLFTVEGGHRAIVFNRIVGIKNQAPILPVTPNRLRSVLQIYGEGTHFMLPWFERPIDYDVRAKPNVISSTSGSKDLQNVGGVRVYVCAILMQVNISLRVLTRPDPLKLQYVYRTLGKDYAERVLPSIIQVNYVMMTHSDHFPCRRH